jgi:hypothetical protein
MGTPEGKIDSQKTSACLRGAATWWLVAMSPIFFCENSGSLAILTAIHRACRGCLAADRHLKNRKTALRDGLSDKPI